MTDLKIKILAALRKNACRTTVAKQLGVHLSTVSNVATANGTPKKPRSTLEASDADLIEGLSQQGISRQEICEKFDCTRPQLTSFTKKYGIELFDGRTAATPETKAIRSKAGRKMKLVMDGKELSPRVERILELGILGWSDNRIAADVKRSVSYVKRMLEVHKVKGVSTQEQEMKRKIKEAERMKLHHNNSLSNAMVAMYGLSRGKACYWIKKLAA